MLLALRESEETSVRRTPFVEEFDDRFHQTFANTAVPKIRLDRQWSEEADTAPVSCEVRTDNFAIHLGSKSSFRIREPTISNVRGVAHEQLPVVTVSVDEEVRARRGRRERRGVGGTAVGRVGRGVL